MLPIRLISRFQNRKLQTALVNRYTSNPSLCLLRKFYRSEIASGVINRSFSSEVNSNSWAAEDLEKQGEKLSKGPELPVVEYNEDLVSNHPQKIKDLVNSILSLNVVEIHQLMNLIQKRLGLTDEEVYARSGGGGGVGGAMATESAASAPAPEPVKVKEAFDLKLTVVDAKSKIKIIKEVRALTSLGLKEAKDLVEKAPVVIKEGMKKEDAESAMKILVEAGAQVELI